MDNFTGLPLELKWHICRVITVDDHWADDKKCLDRWDVWLSKRYVRAVGNLRLTCRQNAYDLVPALVSNINLHISLDSYGLRQLQWCANSLLAPRVTTITFMRRNIMNTVLMYKGYASRRALPVRVKQWIEECQEPLAECLYELLHFMCKHQAPCGLSNDQWKNQLFPLGRHDPPFNRRMAEEEHLELLADEGTDEQLTQITILLREFLAIKSISIDLAYMFKRTLVNNDGSETVLEPFYNCHSDFRFRLQSYRWPVRAPFEAHIPHVLSRLPYGLSIRDVTLPLFSHCDVDSGQAPCLVTKDIVTSAFKNLQGLEVLRVNACDLWNDSKQCLNENLMTEVGRFLARHPLPMLRCLRLESATEQSALLNTFLRVISVHQLRTLHVEGVRSMEDGLSLYQTLRGKLTLKAVTFDLETKDDICPIVTHNNRLWILELSAGGSVPPERLERWIEWCKQTKPRFFVPQLGELDCRGCCSRLYRH